MNYIKQQVAELDKKIEAASQLLTDPDLGPLAQAEIDQLKKQKEELLLSVNQSTSDTLTHRSTDSAGINPNVAILEIRSAAGGDEAGIFAGNLTRMYTKFAQKRGWKTEELNRSEGKLDQIKEVVLKIEGKDCFDILKYESGVHRVQRVPITESSGRIHTSTATVAVLPKVSEKQITINSSDIEFAAFRSSGAGGQNVNKVSTAVRLKHIPSGIIVTSQTQRSQLQNRENALALLRSKLWEMEQQKNMGVASQQRIIQIGTGQRSEKIRTYNFPQNRVTDHRIKKSWHNLEGILDGDLDEIIKSLKS